MQRRKKDLKTECYREIKKERERERESSIPENLNNQQRHCHNPKVRKERQGAEVNQPTVPLRILRIRICLHKQRNNCDVKQNRQCMYNVTVRRVRATIVAVEKTKRITQPVCVVIALSIQHAMRMRRIVICGLPLYIFPHYLINSTIFEKK